MKKYDQHEITEANIDKAFRRAAAENNVVDLEIKATIKDASGKDVFDYAKDSKNPKIKELFLGKEISQEEFKQILMRRCV